MKNIHQFLQESHAYGTIPVTYQRYTDTLTPIQIFERLREEAVYLLESGDHTSSWSRYSFIGLHPFLTISEESEQMEIADLDSGEQTIVSNLQQAFETTFQRLRVKLPDVPLPFHGGGVGFVSYDAVSDFEGIADPQEDDLNLPNYHFVFCRTLIAFDHHTNQIYVIRFVRITDGEGEEEKKQKFYQAHTHMEELLEQLTVHQSNDAFFSVQPNKKLDMTKVTSNYDIHSYKQDVEKIKEYIRQGDIFQAVLSQRFSKTVTIQGFQLYRVLRQVNPSPYMFYLSFQDYEVIGSSPERLVQIDNRQVEIHPIAGTRPRGQTEQEDQQLAEDLLHDEKEKAEHYMLVDLARNDVGRVATYGSVQTPVLEKVTRFSHVMHLISQVTGELKEGLSPLQAFVSAFPAGTLSGAPKIRAMEIINELEPTARNLYGGGVVYYGFDGNLDSCIAIRTILLKDKKAHVQAGAGIVADSVPEEEWQETVNKASALLHTIEMAENIFGNSQKEETPHA